MIGHIDITGVGKFSPSDAAKDYIKKRIGKLDRFAPRSSRKSVRADVKVSRHGKGSATKYQVEVILQLADKKVTAKATEKTEAAATDSVEQKLASQLKKYKSSKVEHMAHRKMLAKFKKSFARGR